MNPLPQLLLSGGEPFLRKDVAGIVHAFYLHASTRQISIPTNGALPNLTLPSVEMILEKCPDAFLNINLSLDGIGDDHDQLRGLKGCFIKLCETYEGLERLRKHHQRLSVNVLSTITSNNADKLENIFNYVKENFDVNYHYAGLVRGNVDANEKDFDMELVESRIEAIYNKKMWINEMPLFDRFTPAVASLLWKILKQARRQKERPFDCRAGRKMIVLDHQGDIYPCEPLWLEHDVREGKEASELRMARLQDYDFNVPRALRSPRAIAIKNFVDEKKCSCTYGCAMMNSIIYSPRMYPRLLKELLHR
jgi:MoaA/NifB/PqqE/SkfB family radical SAM enzyme